MEKNLCEICNPKQWKTISAEMLTKEGYPVYGANGVIGYYSEFNHDKETLLVTCRGATCGSLNISIPFSYVNGNAMALDDLNKDIDIRYLYYFLQGRGLTDTITGSAQPQIVRQSLQKVRISYPLLTEQKNLVKRLDKVTDLISLRKQQLSKLDELIKSRFIEMFGDPVQNPMKWDYGTIRDVVTEVKYGTSRPADNNGKYKYLRMNNITYDGHLDLSDIKYIDIPENEIEKCVAQKGDILFNRTNSKELVGKTCVYELDTPMIIAGYIIRVRVNEKVLPIYLSSVLNSKYGKSTLFDMCKSIIGQANINAQELQNIKILIPPIELQNQYATFVSQVDKSKLEVQKSLDKLETLKKALMQKYFG